MNNNYKGYSLFNDVENVEVRSWNRCVTFFTIFKTLGKEEAQNYVRTLDDIARGQVQKMLQRIRETGYGNARKQVIDSHSVS